MLDKLSFRTYIGTHFLSLPHSSFSLYTHCPISHLFLLSFYSLQEIMQACQLIYYSICSGGKENLFKALKEHVQNKCKASNNNHTNTRGCVGYNLLQLGQKLSMPFLGVKCTD